MCKPLRVLILAVWFSYVNIPEYEIRRGGEVARLTKPSWLKVKIPSGESHRRLQELFKQAGIHTICSEALCPNIAECSSNGVATFLLLGNRCTRDCLYCNVKQGKPELVDAADAGKIADAVNIMQLRYVVITSVTRDDMDDGGASVFVETISQIRQTASRCKIEALVPDFCGSPSSINRVVDAHPFVFAHNLEVTEELFRELRPQGGFRRSLAVLRTAKAYNAAQKTKSGLMVGFGETKEQVVSAMMRLRDAGVDIFTVGQYLQPSARHYPVVKYYTPEEFKELEDIGYALGFSTVNSGPLVRSSYRAGYEHGI